MGGLILASCSSAPQTKVPSSFNRALNLMDSGETFSGVKLFELACTENHELSCWAAGRRKGEVGALSIAQHSTDLNSTQMTVVTNDANSYLFYVRNKLSGKINRPSRVQKKSALDKVVFIVDFKNLALRDPSLWKNWDAFEFVVASAQKIVDRRDFRLLNPEDQEANIAVASCASDFFQEHKNQWTELLAKNPDALFLIGDNVYVDYKNGHKLLAITKKTIWERYFDARDIYQLFRSPRLVPIYANWDDHDYGANNAGANFKYKETAKKVFDTFFPKLTNQSLVATGPGVSGHVRLSGQSFYFLDNRSFRSPEKSKVGQTHFGKVQENWLFSAIAESKDPVWLISGDQFFGAYHPHESYQGNHPVSFDQFIFRLRQADRKVIFLSGDRHLSEIMKIPPNALGKETFELTSSGIHTKMYPGSFKKWPNPLQIEGVDGSLNYMLLNSKVLSSGLQVNVKSFGPGNQILFQRTLEVR